MAHTVYLGFGANLGERLRAMGEAAARINRLPGTALRADSALYETTAVGGPPGHPVYVNGVVRIETRLGPVVMLRRCLEIERDLGRRRSVADGPRTIDVDILFYDALVLDTPELTLPHPRLHLRRFVLQPLADLAPELRHPRLGLTVRELLDRLPESDGLAVRRVADAGWASR